MSDVRRALASKGRRGRARLARRAQSVEAARIGEIPSRSEARQADAQAARFLTRLPPPRPSEGSGGVQLRLPCWSSRLL